MKILAFAALGPVLTLWHLSTRTDSRAYTLTAWAVIAWSMLVFVGEVARW